MRRMRKETKENLTVLMEGILFAGLLLSILCGGYILECFLM